MDYFIFDMDGTIFDTEKFYYQSWIDTGKSNNFTFTMDDKMALSGRQDKEAIAYMVEKFEMKEDEAVKIRADLNRLRDERFNELSGSLKKPGLIKLLNYLRANNKKIALATSSVKQRMDFLLDREEVRDYFDVLLSSDDIVKGKPDPQIFNLAMEKLGADENKTYIVEDSLAGIKAAKRSGAVAVLILDMDQSEEIKNEADLVFSSLDEFLSFLEDKKLQNIDEDRKKTFKLKCPSCGHIFNRDFPTAIFKESSNFRLLKENKLGLSACPSCGHSFRLNYRFAYTDSENKLFFVNDPNFSKKLSQLAFKSSLKLVGRLKGEDMSGYLIRMTTNSSKLLEKVKIFEDGKKDTIIELMKLAIVENKDFQFNKDQIRGFFYKNKDKFLIRTNKGDFEMDFVENLYESLFEKYKAFLDIKDIEMIDQAWAREFLKSL